MKEYAELEVHGKIWISVIPGYDIKYLQICASEIENRLEKH